LRAGVFRNENSGPFFVFGGLEVMKTRVLKPDGAVGYDLALDGVRIFDRYPAPGEVRIRYENPVCKRDERCKGCPYPAHGFICWRENGNCLKTDMEEIRRKEKQHERNHL
jgi:hypothetical protein